MTAAENLRGRIGNAFRATALAPIRLYRIAISPVLPPSCRFQPTCSGYAIEAINTHGVIKGTGLAIRRILRCHPVKWLGGGAGFDPVPQAKDLIKENARKGNTEERTALPPTA